MNERRASVVGASALSSQKACSASPNRRSNSSSATGSPCSARQWSFSSRARAAPWGEPDTGTVAGGEPCAGAERSRARRSGAGMFARHLVEVLEQLAAVLGRDRLGMELHAPHRAAGVLDAHHDAVLGPRRDAPLAERAADGERVVAHDREVLGNAGEQPLALVLDAAEAPVHDHRRARHLALEHVSEALVAEAHAEHGRLGEAQDIRADAEVVPAVRASRTGRDHDRVEVPARERAPGDEVVVHHDRLLAGDGCEQVEDVVGVGVVVVDQQRAHGAVSSPSPRALRSSSVCTTRSTGSERSRSRYQIARCLR